MRTLAALQILGAIDARNVRRDPLLRWMIYHRVNTLPANESVILWVATESE